MCRGSIRRRCDVDQSCTTRVRRSADSATDGTSAFWESGEEADRVGAPTGTSGGARCGSEWNDWRIRPAASCRCVGSRREWRTDPFPEPCERRGSLRQDRRCSPIPPGAFRGGLGPHGSPPDRGDRLARGLLLRRGRGSRTCFSEPCRCLLIPAWDPAGRGMQPEPGWVGRRGTSAVARRIRTVPPSSGERRFRICQPARVLPSHPGRRHRNIAHGLRSGRSARSPPTRGSAEEGGCA
jgi:hypothetical protein